MDMDVEPAVVAEPAFEPEPDAVELEDELQPGSEDEPEMSEAEAEPVVGAEAPDSGTEAPGTEDPGSGFADELDFLESLSLGETGPFDAVSAMLDEEEKASDGPG